MLVASIEPVGAVALVAALLIVLALVFYLVATILQLRKITAGLDTVIASVSEIVQKSAPVSDVVNSINGQLDAGVDLLEGLLVQKAGMHDAVGLVEGLYAGSAAAGFRQLPRERRRSKAPRIGEVYTKGTLTLARLGREAPIAMANPAGPVLRNVEGGSLAARLLYPEIRQTRPEALPRSPVIGTDSPVQYEQRDDIGAPRRRLPPSKPGGNRPNEPERNTAARPGILSLSGGRSSPPDCKRSTCCRLLRHSSMSVRRASRARSRPSRGSAPRRGSSPAATACCR